MKLEAALASRLEFLTRVTQKESQYLLDTDKRLFGQTFTIADAQRINADPILAERLDAFVSRFGRLQDTIGDKLLPALLAALADALPHLRTRASCRRTQLHGRSQPPACTQ